MGGDRLESPGVRQLGNGDVLGCLRARRYRRIVDDDAGRPCPAHGLGHLRGGGERHAGLDLAGGERYRESASFRPGDGAVVADTPWGRGGLSICYDLRFPELYRSLANEGAELFSVPAAFTFATGTAHWHTLLRARAIENLAYVIAAGQHGTHPNGRTTYGHSMIVDPWGTILAQVAEQGEGIAVADLDLNLVAEIRRDPDLSEEQKKTLIRIYTSFRHENEGGAGGDEEDRPEIEGRRHFDQYRRTPLGADVPIPTGGRAGRLAGSCRRHAWLLRRSIRVGKGAPGAAIRRPASRAGAGGT